MMLSHKATILVVEDNPEILEFFEILLMSKGYQVITAEDGHSGLEHARTSLVHAVILDRRLPDMDGLDVCRQLRECLGPVCRSCFQRLITIHDWQRRPRLQE